MKIETNLAATQAFFADMVKRQIPFANIGMVNNLAFKIRDEIKDEMKMKLEQPITPYARDMMRVTKATGQTGANSFVFVSDHRKEDRTLGHLFKGGYRHWKNMESQLMYAGILKKGYYAIPGAGAPKNRYGNISPAFVQMILSYFETWGKSGERGTKNMTPEKRAKKARIGKTKEGYKTIKGVVYFVSYGKLNQWDAGDLRDKTGVKVRPQPLDYGIWAKTGVHGFQVKPVLLFLPRRRGYQRYFNLFATGQKVRDTHARQYFADALLKGIQTSKHLRELQRAYK